MSEKILAINPGSTSTKISVYDGETPLFVETINHAAQELEPYERIADQFDFRKDVIIKAVESHGIDINDIAVVVGRGGLTCPVEAGAYLVDETMVEFLTERPVYPHASNLGAIIADAIAKTIGVNAYIYDSVVVDQVQPIAKITGIPSVKREIKMHVLNSRASALRYARETGKNYNDLNIIVGHLGGGFSTSFHSKGRIIDCVSDDEGGFTPERAGAIATYAFGQYLAEYMKENTFHPMKMVGILSTQCGMKAILGTNDARKVEQMIEDGDEKAALVYEAMAEGAAKSIGKLSVISGGKVDAIVLTGGLAHSEILVNWIKDRVDFIAPVIVYPGENEMDALSKGALRVLRGEEQAHKFKVG